MWTVETTYSCATWQHAKSVVSRLWKLGFAARRVTPLGQKHATLVETNAPAAIVKRAATRKAYR